MPDSVANKWVDIVSPLAPSHTIGLISIAIVVLLLVVLLAMAVMLYRRPRLRAKRALQKLARDMHHTQFEAKTVCAHIRKYLRNGFEQRQLQSIKWFGSDNTDWEMFVKRLAKYSFASSSPSVDELGSIIREAQQWLTKKAVTN